MQGIAPLPSTQSEHDFHKFGIHPNSVAPGFHFHLAASINPDTGMIKYSGKWVYIIKSFLMVWYFNLFHAERLFFLHFSLIFDQIEMLL